MTLQAAIKAQARALGFDLVGITTAEPFPEADAAYQQWIDDGAHAGMDYMAAHRDRVGDPRRARPGARPARVEADTVLAQWRLPRPWPHSEVRREGARFKGENIPIRST